MPDNKTNLNVTHSNARSAVEHNRPLIEGTLHEARPERRKHFGHVEVRRPLPLTGDAATIAGYPQALIAVSYANPCPTQPPFISWNVERHSADLLSEATWHRIDLRQIYSMKQTVNSDAHAIHQDPLQRFRSGNFDR